jgi:hypothetical protein
MKALKYTFILLILVTACHSKTNQEESPLAVVIKLQAAESFFDLKEAQKFIDVERVFGNMASDTLTAKDAWESVVMFGKSLARDKKFTNFFRYYEYKITEEVSKHNASVYFESINRERPTRKIIFSLESRNNHWIVVSIKYQGGK